VPEFVASPPAALWPEAAIGFHGKLPARGDFVGAGLPRRFVDCWDEWMRQGIAASREALGEGWVAAWLEAAIWRFALAPGICGPDAAIGLWLPSVDRVGRHFPLTVAAVVPGADPSALIREGGGFLAAAERTGLAALFEDLGPEEIAARLAEPGEPGPAAAEIDPTLCPPDGALWWTEGAPRVPAGAMPTSGLPGAETFAAMLDAGAGAAVEARP